MTHLAHVDQATAEDNTTLPGVYSIDLLSRWLEAGTAVVSMEGMVQDLNPSFASWLRLSENGWQKLPVENVLQCFGQEFISAWKRWSSGTERFHNGQLKITGLDRVHFFQLELARAGDLTVARLQSQLPPLGEIQEGNWAERLDSEPARREMFMRLVKAEEQLRKLVHRWPGVIFTQRPDFSFDFISSQVEPMLGLNRRDWQRNPNKFWQLVHEGDIAELEQQIRQCARTGKAMSLTYRLIHAQTGKVVYMLEHREPVVTSNGLLLGYEGIWLDVTRQNIAEKRLSSAAWKETLAVLTMGLAHDFSNVMAGIHSLSETFLYQIEKDHPFHEGLNLIRQNSMAASQLVHRIINLHLGKTGERNYHDLNVVVADLSDLIRKIIPRRIEVVTELSSEQLPLFMDLVEFNQVVINLCLNAADAMPQRGKLTLSTCVMPELPASETLQGQPPRPPVVCLSVKDTGCGIKPRHLKTIFEAFFTTKAMNKGSGLGLYNARLFVEKHSGAISVESREGAGTTFYLLLPQADFSEAERGMPYEISPSQKRKTLLLVAHPGDLLEDTAEFFRSNGYHVVVAISAENASDVLASSEYQFSGIFMVYESESQAFLPLCMEAHNQKPPLKTMLHLVGNMTERLNAELHAQVDLLITPELSQQEILNKVSGLLEQETS
ncbi:MAG: hypothetical protein JWM04_1053 [Verrucomicrobiales bacterium]|nr:hypothetical protein [Verrucomicrobiales bacterium]